MRAQGEYKDSKSLMEISEKDNFFSVNTYSKLLEIANYFNLCDIPDLTKKLSKIQGLKVATVTRFSTK